jgi:hypothetical protein
MEPYWLLVCDVVVVVSQSRIHLILVDATGSSDLRKIENFLDIGSPSYLLPVNDVVFSQSKKHLILAIGI